MKSQETPNPKCRGCLCYWKPDESDIKKSGLPYKTCVKCRARKLKDKALPTHDLLMTEIRTFSQQLENLAITYSQKVKSLTEGPSSEASEQ